MESRIKGKWFVIYEEREKEILKTSMQLAVYMAIKSFLANGKRSASISTREIADRSLAGKSSVGRTIKALVKLGLVEIIGKQKRLGGSSSMFQLSQIGTLNTTKRPTDGHLKSESVPNRDESVPSLGTKSLQSKKQSLAKSSSLNNNQHEDRLILSHVHKEILPKRTKVQIQNPEAYAKSIARKIATALVENKQYLLYPTEDSLKTRAFKARVELGLEKIRGAGKNIDPNWTDADKLFYAIDHSYGVDYLQEAGLLK